MSLASRYGKLRIGVEDDGTRFRRLEDLLTGDVFGAYRYLPAPLGVGRLLEHALSADRVSLRAWAEARGVRWADLSCATFAFWPSLAGKEPDLVVALGSEDDRSQLVVLVEVKLFANQHEIGGVSQLGFYGAAMLDDLFDEEPFDLELPPLRPVVLVTADAECPTSALIRARRELGGDEVQGRTEAFWVSWTTAAVLASETLDQRRRDGRPSHEIAVLEDVVADLAERGFTPPRARTSFPLPSLAALAMSWGRGWTSRGSARAAGRPALSGIHLDRIEEALKSWRLR